MHARLRTEQTRGLRIGLAPRLQILGRTRTPHFARRLQTFDALIVPNLRNVSALHSPRYDLAELRHHAHLGWWLGSLRQPQDDTELVLRIAVLVQLPHCRIHLHSPKQLWTR